MTRVPAILALVAAAITQSGCVVACGPYRTVPAQRLAIIASSPGSYTVRVHRDFDAPIDKPVPPDGRLAFDVPVASREGTIYFLRVPVYRYPPPDTLRVILVRRGDRTIRKLSAQDIGRLPTGAGGYHLLRIEK